MNAARDIANARPANGIPRVPIDRSNAIEKSRSISPCDAFVPIRRYTINYERFPLLKTFEETV